MPTSFANKNIAHFLTENLSDWKKEMKKEKARLKGNWRERPAPMTGDTAEIIQTGLYLIQLISCLMSGCIHS